MKSSPPRRRRSRAAARGPAALDSRVRGNDPSRPLRVLHAAAELFPWVRTGGLGDVIAALPQALLGLGVDARLLLPGFAGFVDAFELGQSIRLRTPFAVERVRVARTLLPGSGVAAYIVDHPAFYDRPGNPYAAADGGDWP